MPTAPGDRIRGRRRRQRHRKDRAETGADPRGVGDVGPRVRDDHATEAGGISGADDRAEIPRFLNSFDDQQGPVRVECDVGEWPRSEADHADHALVTVAESDAVECLVGKRGDPRATGRESRQPVAQRWGIGGAERLGIDGDEHLDELRAGRLGTRKFPPTVDECQAGHPPRLGVAKRRGLLDPRVGGACDRFRFVHGAGATRAKEPRSTDRPVSSVQVSEPLSIRAGAGTAAASRASESVSRSRR